MQWNILIGWIRRMLCLKRKGAIVSQHDVLAAGLGKTTHDAAEGEAE